MSAPFPISFNVAEHATSSFSSSSSSRNNNNNSQLFHQIGQQNEAKALKQLRMDVGLTVALSDSPSVAPDTLRSALSSLSVGTWLDIVQERHLLGRCGYPTCSRSPSRPFHPSSGSNNSNSSSSRTPQLKLTASGKILDYAERAPYCSVACLRRAQFVQRNSLPQRTGLLWDDVVDGSSAATASASSISPLLQEGAPPSSPGSNEMIASLPIVERPTQASAATPPRPGQADFEARSHTRPMPSSNNNSSRPPRQFILNKRMRTRAAAAEAQTATTANTTSARRDDEGEDVPSLDSLSLYDQAMDSTAAGAPRDRIQDDMSDQERAIWMAGRDLRDQLRREGELD